MDTFEAIKTRKSVRDYLTKNVEPDLLAAVLQAANSAPQAGEFHISVVQNAAIIKEINDKALSMMKASGNDFLMERANLPGYQPLYGAPLLLVFSAPQANPYSLANVSNAATTAGLAATALGLSSCYVVTPTLPLGAEAALAAKTGVPVGYQAMCGLLLGYAASDKFATASQPADNISYCK